MTAPTDPGDDESLSAAVRSLRSGWIARVLETPSHHNITRSVLLRALAGIYFIAFLSLHLQILPLLGSHGMLPIRQYLDETLTDLGGSRLRAAFLVPSLFWLGASDTILRTCSALGVLLSIAALAGATNALIQLSLWGLYLSFVDVGQIFYGYGWESLLVEAGFLSIFLCPVRRVRPFHRATEPPTAVIWLFRWLAFRVMIGAGLIKLRGDPCWRDLTCLAFHYETQPVPGPLSAAFHQAPMWFHKAGAVFNHTVELVVPWFIFGPRRSRQIAGCLLVVFQLVLIASGNLSFLNWLTLAVCLSCFDDTALARLVPLRLRALASPATRPARIAAAVLTVCVALLSIPIVINMASPQQRMNASFEPFRLVNTYGAFGSVGRNHREIVLSGTQSESPDDPRAVWREYEFPCKPGDVRRRPCWITPYHYRLDWQMWFAAMSRASQEPWFMHMVWKLLHGDRGVRALLAHDPFDGVAPRWIRADLFVYQFRASRHRGEPWWERQRVGTYLPPLRADDPDLREYMNAYGWNE